MSTTTKRRVIEVGGCRFELKGICPEGADAYLFEKAWGFLGSSITRPAAEQYQRVTFDKTTVTTEEQFEEGRSAYRPVAPIEPVGYANPRYADACRNEDEEEVA